MKSEKGSTPSHDVQLKLPVNEEKDLRTIVIPIITGDECDKQFMIHCLRNTGEVFALHVVDPNTKSNDLEEVLKRGKDTASVMREFFHGRRVEFRDIEQWGELADRITALAKRVGADAIVMPKKAEKWAPDFGMKTEFV